MVVWSEAFSETSKKSRSYRPVILNELFVLGKERADSDVR